MLELQKTINALVVFTLCGILLAAFGVQFIEHEQPCPLCMLQRLAMVAVASTCLLNLCFGIHPANYGLALICSLAGGLVALRQISLHVCPGFSTFGTPVFGLSLYTWSFVIFCCCILAVALLLFLYNPRLQQKAPVEFNLLGKSAFFLLFFIAIANIFTTLSQCGLGPCQD